MIFAGLDPSAKAENVSGLCLMDAEKNILELRKWHTREELLRLFLPYQKEIRWVGIDGPLQPPHELYPCCFEENSGDCPHEQTTPFKGRYCEFLLNKNGFRCFTTSKNGFAKSWALRCFKLNEFLTAEGYRTVEVFPHASRRILFPDLVGKKQTSQNRKMLRQKLRKEGLKFPPKELVYTHDELDAVMAAYTVFLKEKGQTLALGDWRDGFVGIPRTDLKYF